MTQASDTRDERARKNLSLILQRLSSVGQARLAESLNVSEATVSRWKAEQAEQFSKILAELGIKCVPIEMQCYQPDYIRAIFTLAQLQMSKATPESLWEGQE